MRLFSDGRRSMGSLDSWWLQRVEELNVDGGSMLGLGHGELVQRERHECYHSMDSLDSYVG